MFKNQRVTIVGAKRSGIAAARMAQRLGSVPFVTDAGAPEKLKSEGVELKALEIPFEFGGHTIRALQCDLLVVSPGVPSDAKIIKDAISADINVISEIEYASQIIKANLYAITGSNGKTTCTTLLNHIFECAKVKSYMAGNIGYALSGIALQAKEDEFVSLEVSSFQLDFIEKFKPKVAMLLNITPDHLNRYENSFEKYARSKHRITENQDANDLLILNFDDKGLRQFECTTKARTAYFTLVNKVDSGAFLEGDIITVVKNCEVVFSFNKNEMKIKGEHNVANAMACIIAAKEAGIANDAIAEGLRTFGGVEHRLEVVPSKDGKVYVNDSKATNVDSVWFALRSFETKINLILGGTDKGNDYNAIKDLVAEKVKKIYAIGSSREKVYDFFKEIVPVVKIDTLDDCVLEIHNSEVENEILLLSPACASFDMFNNYEHRGEVFKETIKRIAL